MTKTQDIQLLLDLYAAGPDEEDNDCRNCHKTMMPMPESATEPTVFCHSCAQELLELLVEKYKRVHKHAKSGWDVARLLAITYNAPATEHAADLVLEELGDA